MFRSIATSRLAVVLLALGTTAANAALPPRSPESLVSSADAVVEGVVQSLESKLTSGRTRWVNRVWTLKLKLTQIEKEPEQVGPVLTPTRSLEVGGELTATCWQWHSRPDGFVGPTGVAFAFGDAANGDKLKLYLRKGSDPEDPWEILQPNGVEAVHEPVLRP